MNLKESAVTPMSAELVIRRFDAIRSDTPGSGEPHIRTEVCQGTKRTRDSAKSDLPACVRPALKAVMAVRQDNQGRTRKRLAHAYKKRTPSDFISLYLVDAKPIRSAIGVSRLENKALHGTDSTEKYVEKQKYQLKKKLNCL